jgi:membrane-associated protease RseP (regulator of RpoE activity)
MPVLQVILILALLIFVHELGHFMAARLQGIYANRFSIGFGPVVWKYQGPQTEYALRALPLGGFVGFPDDDPDSDIPRNDPNLLRNRPVFDRVIVISAGVIANLIFAYLVLMTQVGLVGVPSGLSYKPGVVIPEVIRNSVAEQAGIKAGDVVLAIDNQELPAAEETRANLQKAIAASPDKVVKFRIDRAGEILEIPVTPKAEQVKDQTIGRIGVNLQSNGDPLFEKPKSIGQLLTVSAQQFEIITVRTVQGFGQLITNFGSTVKQVAGPVAIVSEGAKIAKSDPTNLFTFAALISINLAVINILPLPALDGGQLLFLMFEALLGKPLPQKLQDGVMQTGLVMMLGLGVFLIIRDTANLLPR